MEKESIVINGSHEADIESEEKVLKPRKPFLSNGEDGSTTIVNLNGNNENSSADNVENNNIENGFDGDLVDEDTVKQNGRRSMRQKIIHDKRETTPKKQSKKEHRSVKESTPKPVTPTKRELRQREATPKPETPTKRESKHRGTTSEKTQGKSPQPQIEDAGTVVEEFLEGNGGKPPSENINEPQVEQKFEKCVVLVDDVENEEDLVVTIDDSQENVDEETPVESSIFSVFRRSFSSNSSTELKDVCEASSSTPSVICLDTPPVTEEKIVLANEIKGRKAINSFSRFPGRNISITSLDRSLKRKADVSYTEDVERKKFAGETDQSGSEKSPGWRFFSPTFSRVWSPLQALKKSPTIQSSTPFHKKIEQDSMAVNYDEDTKLSLEDSMQTEVNEFKEDLTTKSAGKYCTIM